MRLQAYNTGITVTLTGSVGRRLIVQSLWSFWGPENDNRNDYLQTVSEQQGIKGVELMR